MINNLKNSYSFLKDKNKELQSFYNSYKDKAINTIYGGGDKTKIAITTQNSKGVGFNFIITEQEAIDLKANITDYVLENNTMVQSGYTPQPLVITLNGKVAELYTLEKQKPKYFDRIQQGLNKFSGIGGGLATKAQEYFNKVNNVVDKVNNIVDKVDNAFDFVNNLFNVEEEYKTQLKSFKDLKTLYETKELFTVETFFDTFDNMLIESLSFSQDESKYTTNINITLKQITFASIRRRKKNNSGIAKVQKSEPVKNEVNKSVLKKIFNYF